MSDFLNGLHVESMLEMPDRAVFLTLFYLFLKGMLNEVALYKFLLSYLPEFGKSLQLQDCGMVREAFYIGMSEQSCQRTCFLFDEKLLNILFQFYGSSSISSLVPGNYAVMVWKSNHKVGASGLVESIENGEQMTVYLTKKHCLGWIAPPGSRCYLLTLNLARLFDPWTYGS
jgi:hypothetical protein